MPSSTKQLEIDWTAVSRFFEEVLERADHNEEIKVTIVCESLGKQMTVLVPAPAVPALMAHLPTWEAEIKEI